ncbi:MAG TPA: tripartite tricarboxylate transporter TctB family protein [Magnetospirillaceae bacterium]|nr:tripartite tricarboxylate transporter TctB family protein [Magnetospirillaceae bacterium]
MSSNPIRPTSPAILSGVFLVIFASAAGVAALNYPPGAASMPIMIGAVGAVLSLLQLVVELRRSRGAFEEKVDLRKDLPIYGWVWGFVLAVIAFGFLPAAPLMLLAYLRLRSKESWKLSLILSAAVFVLLYGLFQRVLGVPLFEGLITPLILDGLMPS